MISISDLYHGIFCYFYKSKSHFAAIFAGMSLFLVGQRGYEAAQPSGSDSSENDATESHRYNPSKYLKAFSTEEYLIGKKAALKHLQGFKKRFPDDPMQIYVYLLLGHVAARQNSGRAAALVPYFAAEEAWNRLDQRKLIPASLRNDYEDMLFFARLERARQLLNAAEGKEAPMREAEQAIEILNNLKGVLAYQLSCDYLLAKAESLLGKQVDAEKRLNGAILDCKRRGIYKDDTLSAIYMSLGVRAYQTYDYEAAIRLFLLAEESAVGSVVDSQRLRCWHYHSLCLEALGEEGKALSLLSRIVNSPIASSLRVQAMARRADLYIKRGERALAIKQLKTIAAKGGAWRKAAQTRLVELNMEKG